MAPVDFDKELRDRLQNRKITPSREAWDRIARRLEAQGAPPRKNRPVWGYLAAACVVVLLGWRLLWPDTGTVPVIDTPAVVTPTPVPEPRQPEAVIQTAMEQVATVQPRVSEKLPLQDKPVVLADHPDSAAVALSQPETLPDTTALEWRIARELEALVAQADALEGADGSISDALIDSLLRAAESEITGTYRPAIAKDSIDPMALLAEVEDELDQSFRDAIFDRLKTGFYKVRTAVADRNH